MIYFTPLDIDAVRSIAELALRSLEKRLDERRLKIAVSDAAKKKIVTEAYSSEFGARPLKRYIQSNIETLIARVIIEKDPEPDSLITVDLKDGTLTASI